MNNPKYTFLLPAYKACFFEEALLSIKNQTYTNFVCIVSDDCSPEDLKSVFDKVCADDPRFSYRRNEQNIGGKNLVKHWNMLVNMCETEYLIMASDDDLYYKNYVEEIDRLTTKYPKVNILNGRVQRIDSKGDVLIKGSLAEEYLDSIHFVYYYFRDIHCLQNHCYKTSALKHFGGFVNFPQAWYSDDATNIIMSDAGCANTSSVVFGFRCSNINISSITKEAIIIQKIQATIAYNKWFLEFFDRNIKDNCKNELWLADTILQMHSDRTRAMLNDLLTCLPPRQLMKCIKMLRREGLAVSCLLIYRYIKNRCC